MNIHLLSRDEIDKNRYNGCVHYAVNGNLFGYHWYLDAMARHWDVLVEEDYQSVLPLPRQELPLGHEALIQPELLRQLAVYSVRALSPKRIEAFWEAIPDTYKVIDLAVDAHSRPTDDSFQQEEINNYYLRLDQPYEQLAAQFTPDFTDRLAIAEDADLLPTTSLKPEQIAELYRRTAGGGRRAEERFHGLQRIMYNALHRGWGSASAVHNKAGELLAANFFIISHGRVVSQAPVTTPAGQRVEALTFLFDMLIRSHANRPLVLDFNTDDASLAAAMGAVPGPYFRIRRDQRRFGLF